MDAGLIPQGHSSVTWKAADVVQREVAAVTPRWTLVELEQAFSEKKVRGHSGSSSPSRDGPVVRHVPCSPDLHAATGHGDRVGDAMSGPVTTIAAGTLKRASSVERHS